MTPMFDSTTPPHEFIADDEGDLLFFALIRHSE